MTKALGRLVAILASSTMYDSGIENVSAFVSSPAHLGRRTNHATKSESITVNYAPENDGKFSRVASTGRTKRQKQREQLQDELDQLKKRFKSPVLKLHCGELLQWKETYGHPNIPLKYDGGNACQILRRLQVLKKLTSEEVEWLEEIGFRFHSLEDVYRFADFDELFVRLIAYQEAHPNNNFQVPKKCPEDPELGAWVTGIRRLGKDGVKPDHERRLCAINFVWKSTRKCGSKFMDQYREWTKQVELQGIETVLEDPKTISWIKAQQSALKRGILSQTRIQYMGQLFGDQWTTFGKEDGSYRKSSSDKDIKT